MSQKLFLYFTNEYSQPTTIQVGLAETDLSEATIRHFMEELVKLALFRHKGQLKYAVVKGAAYIEREKKMVF